MESNRVITLAYSRKQQVDREGKISEVANNNGGSRNNITNSWMVVGRLMNVVATDKVRFAAATAPQHTEDSVVGGFVDRQHAPVAHLAS